MSKSKAIVANTTRDYAAMAATVGVVGLGAALIEAALIPGLAIGVAAVLAPRLLPRGLLPRFRRGAPALVEAQRTSALSGLAMRQALAKTITYRIVVTGLDFTWNYLIIGEVAASAGLSAISFSVAPIFYCLHETVWNYAGPQLKSGGDGTLPVVGLGGFSVNRALAKTITFRTFATVTDFATNYVFVRDIGQAAALSAFGFVIGPFLYYGHEKVWGEQVLAKAPAKPPAPRAISLKAAPSSPRSP